MGDAPDGKNKESTTPQAVDVDAFLELNFVPQWARKPPDTVQASRYSEDDTHSRGGGGGRGRSRRSGGGVGRQDRDHGSGGDMRSRRPEKRRERDGGGGAADSRSIPQDVERSAAPDRREQPQTSPGGRSARHGHAGPTAEDIALAERLQVQFLPERKAVHELAKRIVSSRKAYPLLDLAQFLLGHEGLCYVRLEVQDPEHVLQLHQCQLCNTVGLDRGRVVQHVMEDHLQDYFIEETETIEAPSGVFVCVAICGLSGKYLGPPNHHSYAEAVKQQHALHYSHMDIEAYRGKIRISHDEADVARWKESCTTRTVYRRKVPEGEEAGEGLARKDALLFMEREVAEKNIKSQKRVVLRESEARNVQDPMIRRLLHRSWQRNVRFPIQLALALRAALRSRSLHVFKAGSGKGMHFVTPVKPVALNPDTAVPEIRDALRYLESHPGCTREEMTHDLLEGVPSDDPRVRALLQPITWLAEKGHILEFFNGRLAVPRHL